MQVAINVTGTKEEIAKFQKFKVSILDFTEALVEIGKSGKNYYSSEVFGSQGGILGARWAPLSPQYKIWKAKHYPGRGINIRTGKTKESFDYKSSRDELTIYNTNDEVFKFLQLGTSKMPARPMIKVNDGFKEIVKLAIQHDIRSKLERV
jgi:hypothetical protein